MIEKIPVFDTTLSRRVEQLEDALMCLAGIPKRVEALELKAREDEQFTQALNNAPITVIGGNNPKDDAGVPDALRFKRVMDLLPSFDDMRLIAAAPDLLAAARMVDDAWAGNGDMATAVDAILLALAKVPAYEELDSIEQQDHDEQVRKFSPPAKPAEPIDQYVDGYQPPKAEPMPTEYQRGYQKGYNEALDDLHAVFDKNLKR